MRLSHCIHRSFNFFFLRRLHPPRSPLFPYTTLFRSLATSAGPAGRAASRPCRRPARPWAPAPRSEEHTSELQSHHDLVCRLLLEKKNNIYYHCTNQNLNSKAFTTLPSRDNQQS